MSGALEGIRVLDLSTRLAEATGKTLADLGAEVIKVEPPGGCDARTTPPLAVDGSSLFWAAWGLGKYSVVCDIDTPAGQEQLRALAATADVLVESFAPGHLGDRGLGPDHLAAVNPGLVYVSVTPFGWDTPDASVTMTDLTLSAAGGLLAMQGEHDRVPTPVGYPETSFLGAMQAAADTAMALCERDRSGRGQHLDSSMQAAVLWSLMSITSYAALGMDFPNRGDDRADRSHPEVVPGVPMPVIEPCADGFVGMTLVVGEQGNRGMKALMNWVIEEGALDDDLEDLDWEKWLEMLGDGSLRPAEAATGVGDLLAFVKTKTQAEIQRRAVADKMLVAPCYTAARLADDPQLAARDFWVEVDGEVHAGPFARLSATPIVYRHPAPALGQHQDLLENLTPPVATPPPPDDPPLAGPAVPRTALFEGLKVADLSWIAAGPLIAKDLANLGATVVRVETEARLDTLRWIPPHVPHSSPMSAGHPMANMNQSKLGLGLNFTIPEAKTVIDRLVTWADVVVENYTPGTAARLGFGYERVRALNPSAVMLSSCMRGQTGPEARHTGFGLHGACLAGFAALTGWPDRAPHAPWGAYTDFISPRYALAALGAALHHRHRTGQGQYIDLSQIEASIHFLAPVVLEYRESGRVRTQAGLSSERAAPHGVYRTAGVERFCALAVETDEQWEALCSVVPELERVDDRWADSAAADGILAAWFADRDGFEAARQLRGAGVPAYMALRPTDFTADPNLVAREFFIELDHGAIGPMIFDGPVTAFSATPARPWRAGPLVGEHTQQVMSEILGFTDEEITTLAATGALT
ncbi:CaiB/BaiF CoA transferase family protein [Candidatus Poriferisocius sp.]|uniref:CaiB/BaiF CoA transferase family protein n=1 Tax=Candidatus Poriferisocius sp. TaxID=3101276 RepID=UPI003B5907F5